ncbi:hypothetical protein F5Y06DRAFT_81177 [Hypoxylon sp. FL0890]|nr:hypothetical protein F5Y06DRAFT_81177 [Hypoxylon sp. FL0890]
MLILSGASSTSIKATLNAIVFMKFLGCCLSLSCVCGRQKKLFSAISIKNIFYACTTVQLFKCTCTYNEVHTVHSQFTAVGL